MPKNEQQKKELIQVQQNAMPQGLSFSALEADAGAGAQNIGVKDLQTPIISVLQSNSPQVNKSHPKYIKGAEQGMFYNNVTGEVYSGEEGLVVVPCFFEKVYVEWKPKRGGFVTSHSADTPLKNKVKLVASADNPDKLLPILPNGNVLIETNQHYILILNADNTFEPAVIACASSFLGASRKWNYLIKSVVVQGSHGPFNPASYYTHYLLRTVAKQKDENSWFSPLFESLGPVPNVDVYNAGKAFEQAVNSGSVAVKQEDVAVADSYDADGLSINSGGILHDVVDDTIPF